MAPLELELAFLYLFSRRGRGHRSRLVRVTAIGLAFGAAALVLTLALLSGFQQAIRREIRAASPGFLAVRKDGGGIAGAESLAGRLARLDGVAGAESRRRGAAWVVNEATSSAAGVTILAAGRLRDDEAEVDAASSAMLSSVPGSRLRVVSGREELTPAGPMPASRVVRVVGHRPSAPRQKGILRISADAFDALAGPGVATEIEILPAPGTDETRLAKAIETALGGEFRVERPEESQRALSAALRLERLVLFAALGLVIVVAASGVAAELSFLAVERRSGAAILRAQGATPAMIRRLYLWVGLLTGMAGGAAGALLGAAVGVILDRTGAIPLPAGLYTIDRLPFDVKGGDVGAAFVLTIALATLAAWIPASRASADEPVVVLRER